MAYLNISDILSEISKEQLAKLTGDTTGTSINYDRINRSLESAQNQIDGQLLGKFELPLKEPVAPLVREIAISLAISQIYKMAKSESSIPPSVYWRENEALENLKKLKQGYFTLDNLLSSEIITNKSEDDKIFLDKNFGLSY